jgi:release factor glutamine methyltransferase
VTETVRAALARAREQVPAAEARLLLQQVLGWTPAQVAAHPERVLEGADTARFDQLVARRAGGEPVAYLLGRREFYGREFAVSPSVLIPRPETELLVELGLIKLRGVAAPRILDLGTGSGCVALSLALEIPDAQVTAADVSPAALAVARGNAERMGAVVQFLESDWFAALGGRFDLIVANPPYVAEGDPHLAVGDLRFEPAKALACGVDGLGAIRTIVATAPAHLAPGGWLLLEHGYDQAQQVRTLLEAAGFADIEQHRDLADLPRTSGGRLTTLVGAP